MIRKFNYTGRRKIPRSRVQVHLFRDSLGRRCFNAGLQLDDLGLPDGAHVYVEAYHRTGYQRFDFGTIGRLHIPADRVLQRFPTGTVPLFRVKAVDRTLFFARILATLDKIRPESVEDTPVGGQCLLYVEYENLGNSIWALNLEGDWPVLRLNSEVDGISLLASGDNRFLSLVYPEVLRQILTRILIEDKHTDPDCDDDWPSLWLKLGSTLPGMSPPPTAGAAEQQSWIESAVESFAARHSLLERFHQAQRER